MQLSGPTTLPERPLRLIPSLQGSYFAIYASNQISFVDDSGALVWTLPTIADNSCLGTSVREVIPAANGDLVVVFIDCVARISPAGAARWKTRLIAQYPQTFRPVTAIETSDGTFVVAGCIGNESAVRAFGADGTTKWTRTDDVFVDSAECAEKLAVTPNGKIWLVVSSGSTCSRSVLIRLGADGTLEYADSRAFSAPLVRVSELEVLSDTSLLALGDGYDEVDRRRVASIRKISTGRNECVLDVTGDGTVDVQSDALPLLRFQQAFCLRSMLRERDKLSL